MTRLNYLRGVDVIKVVIKGVTSQNCWQPNCSPLLYVETASSSAVQVIFHES